MANPDLFVDQVRIVLTAVEPYPANHVDSLKERYLVLSPEAPTVSIGRTSKRNAQLEPAPNNAWIDSAVMSRDHAILRLDADKQHVFVKDIGSLHGTWQNEIRLDKHQLSRLRSGDVLRFGITVERSLQQFPPCVMRVQIHLGTQKRPENKPLVFKVPDETDIEDTDDDFSIQNSMRVLREVGMQPAKRCDISRMDAIDLTVEEDVDACPLPTLKHPPAGDKAASRAEQTSTALNFSDALRKSKLLGDNQKPISAENAHLGGTDKPTGTDVPEAEWEVCSSAESPGTSTKPFTSSSVIANADDEDGRSSNFEDFSMDSFDDGDDDYAACDNESVFSLVLADALEKSEIDRQAVSKMLDGVNSEQHSTVLPEEPRSQTSAVATAASPPGPCCYPPNTVHHNADTNRLPHNAHDSGFNFSSQTMAGTDQGLSDSNMKMHTISLPNPAKSSDNVPRSMVDLLGAKTGKYEFFSAREYNQTHTAADAAASRAAPTDNLWISGQNFLKCPLDTKIDKAASPEAEFNESSAYQFELSKKDAAARTTPLPHSSVEDVILDPVGCSRPNKRKAGDLDDSTTAEAQVAESEPRAIKRFRRAAEVFGYAAIGGVAVMSALIATAPAL